MPYSNEITDEAIVRLLAAVDEVPKPIGQIVRSGEGGEHLVWIVDDTLVLRVRADGQDQRGLVREKNLWSLLSSINPASTVMPICLGTGALDEGERPYGLYRKLTGVSVETSAQSVNAATEKDLAEMLHLLKRTPIDKTREIGVGDAERVGLADLRNQARSAWQRLSDHGHLGDLACNVDIDQALHLSDVAATAVHEPVLLHADLKGEHIFVDPETGRLTGVIDWSDACVGDPAVDIRGLAISVGAAAAARIAWIAGYGGAVAARGAFAARCDSIICLDAILHGDDDAPEWLVRRQLQRALEQV
ncbi:hypothetical protein LLEC1_04799 [Akanthomyces lecanii]|uniref:Aminoglycoside phosphotransferase domain-containing protein n=1 Tax=Cordyceps confragosa TaxID=2714763 RepID=A0A179IB88_CORDF|nr:hypothetical protein LLEC1_04799 [Akanthomyces lecanii]